MMFTIVRLAFGVFILVSLVQIGFAWYLQRSPAPLHRADLVVVFPGDTERIVAGCKLVKDGYSSHLMIINKTESALKKIAAKNGVPADTILLPGGTSRSSFEDVYNTTQAIADLDLEAVILVTSAYHLPRALFLLKSYLAMNGSEVAVQYHPVSDDHNRKRKMQLYYNELVKLWGSSTEMAGNVLTGHLILDYPTVTKVKSWLKKIFLFEV